MATEQIPAELVAGDTWEWTRSLSDYPATTHSAVWYFENKDAVFSVSATPSGSDFAGSATAASTGAYQAGTYRWRLVVTRTADSARYSVETGVVEVLADPAAAGKMDWRSHARRTLDAIEAVIEGRAAVDQMAVTLNGRSLSRTPIADLLLLRDRYRREVRDEDAKLRMDAGGFSGRRIVTRLS